MASSSSPSFCRLGTKIFPRPGGGPGGSGGFSAGRFAPRLSEKTGSATRSDALGGAPLAFEESGRARPPLPEPSGGGGGGDGSCGALEASGDAAGASTAWGSRDEDGREEDGRDDDGAGAGRCALVGAAAGNARDCDGAALPPQIATFSSLAAWRNRSM
mmetsp:Transcript_67956/g.183561  ORF Transcript_67956/g.183561 Transcript_67956/m.183561 type:complete len:159 (+) Transcript_67956:113-589(+)